MIKIQNGHQNVFHMYLLRGTNLFEHLNKIKVLGCTLVWVCFGGGLLFACLFLVLFWGCFPLLFFLVLFSGLKTSSKVFPVEKPRSLFFPLDDR